MADPARIKPEGGFKETSVPSERSKKSEGSGDGPVRASTSSEPTAAQTRTKDDKTVSHSQSSPKQFLLF